MAVLATRTRRSRYAGLGRTAAKFPLGMPTEDTSTRTRRQLLLAAIGDIQGSIHANDSKSAAVLIVHGLLFTGVMTVTSRLGPLFRHASVFVRVAISVELGFAVIFFLTSVLALLWAVVPHRPHRAFIDRNLNRDPNPPDFFYPEPRSLRDPSKSETRVLLDQINRLTNPSAEAGLAYEVVKVQNIQQQEAIFAKWGVWLLLPESLAVTMYLLTIGILALAHP